MRNKFSTAVLLAALVCVTGAQASTRSLPPLPKGWPTTLQLAMADDPGDAASLRKSAPFGFRYQYLAGGVNTGKGWSADDDGGYFEAQVKAYYSGQPLALL